VGFDPQEALTYRDENCDMLNPVAGQMLQLDLVVAQLTTEEVVKAHREPTFMEGDEGDDVVIRRRRRPLMIRQKPLHGLCPSPQQALLDETLHMREGYT
jgi:hypothetical protein